MVTSQNTLGMVLHTSSCFEKQECQRKKFMQKRLSEVVSEESVRRGYWKMSLSA